MAHDELLQETAQLRILVSIASFGTGNDAFLHQLVREYQSMPFRVDIVVCSNVPKPLPGVETAVGLPTQNPRSLAFAHKRLFAERQKLYDLFIYTEDDILITERTIRAFLKASRALAEDELAGCVRFEKSPDGRTFYPDVHNRFHWEMDSVCRRREFIIASFTNEHAGCYLLTREQLKRAIESGGFLVGPHEGKYEMLETAATDPYTQCGFKKRVCISHLDDFAVHHLANKYLGTMGLHSADFIRQVNALKRFVENGAPPLPLFRTEPRLHLIPFSTYYSKSYYEPVRTDVLSMVPASARSVLSIGCGWGAVESLLVARGLQVVCAPLDPVIGACAEARGIQVVNGDLGSVRRKLAGRNFDCVFLSNILHLVEDPADVLASFSSFVREGGSVVAILPNPIRVAALWNSVRGGLPARDLVNYQKTGVHCGSSRAVKKWFRSAGLKLETLRKVTHGRAERLSAATAGLVDRWLAAELVILATKN